MFFRKKPTNFLGETPVKELERRLGALESSYRELWLLLNQYENKWNLHESDLTTIRRHILGIEDHPEPQPDTDNVLFPDPWSEHDRNS